MDTKIIKREFPHIVGLLVDGFIWTMTPTLTFISSQVADGFTKICLQAAVIFLGALGGFRSKAFGDWRDGKRRRDETEVLAKGKTTGIDEEGHLR